MCDYSLHAIASRPARIDDKLVTTEFRDSLTRGFASVLEQEVAVCLVPGTELAFSAEAEFDHPLSRILPRFGFGKIGSATAIFRQVNMSRRDTHHDALEFSNGKLVLLTRLRPGQSATILQLPVSPTPAPAEPAQPLHLMAR